MDPDSPADKRYIEKHFPKVYAGLLHQGLQSMPKVSLPNGEFIATTPQGNAIRGNAEGFYIKDVAASLGVTEDEINQCLDEDSFG